MNELTIIKKNGGAYIDSREVADYIGKRHYDLCRDIARYERIIEKITERKIPFSDFFIESSYLDSTGRKLPCYLVSKRGAEVLANKLTGEKGVRFTFAYVAKFNEMEAAEREAAIKAHARPRLGEFNSAVKNVLSGMSYCDTNPNRVMDFLRGVYKPLGIEVKNVKNDMEYFSATVIAMSLGMYSSSGRPHAHAVSAIIAKLDNWQNHCIAVPYGLVGVSVRYDIEVAGGVLKWLIDRDRPRSIPHLGFEYHVRYKGDLPELDDDVDIYFDDDDDYTKEELDEMCGTYGDCDDCPGFSACCNEV